MATPPVAGLQLRIGDAAPRRVDELVHELESGPRSQPLRPRLKGATLVFDEPLPKPKDATLETRRAYLRSRAEHRAYDKLVRNVREKPIPPEERVGASIRHSFTVSANMVVTPVATGFIGYRLSKGLVPKEQHRVVVGLLIGIGMLLVEMVLYLARSYSVEAHTARRKRRTGRWDGRTVTTKLD